jgi:hypothetical protein
MHFNRTRTTYPPFQVARMLLSTFVGCATWNSISKNRPTNIHVPRLTVIIEFRSGRWSSASRTNMKGTSLSQPNLLINFRVLVRPHAPTFQRADVRVCINCRTPHDACHIHGKGCSKLDKSNASPDLGQSSTTPACPPAARAVLGASRLSQYRNRNTERCARRMQGYSRRIKMVVTTCSKS